MPRNSKAETIPGQSDAMQALGLMTGALALAGWAGHGGSNTIVAIVSASILLMILIASALFLIESRVDDSKRGAIAIFCLPAVALLGVVQALFVASGFVFAALIGFVLAFVFSAYRRLVVGGVRDFVPAAVRDLGLVGGVGVALAGIGMILTKWALV